MKAARALISSAENDVSVPCASDIAATSSSSEIFPLPSSSSFLKACEATMDCKKAGGYPIQDKAAHELVRDSLFFVACVGVRDVCVMGMLGML